MTVVLPGGAPHAPDGPPAAAADIVDFGEGLVRPIAPVRRAAELARADEALAEAARAFDAFGRRLAAGESEPDAWPDSFAREARRLRESGAARLPDGPERDRFDAAFDLFAKAKAVETRRLATHRRIARNRGGLDRLLRGYADIAAQAGDPVVGEFAVEAGEAAIRRQADAHVLSGDEAAALSGRYRRAVAAARARRLIRDDPAAARAALDDSDDPGGGAFAALADEDRAALRSEAARRAQAVAEADEAAEALAAARTQAEAFRRGLAFEASFAEALEAGAASPLTIEDGLAGGLIGEAAAARLREALARDRADRLARARDLRAVEDRLAAGETLDPADPADRAAADAWAAAVVGDEHRVLDEIARQGAADEPATLIRYVARRLGFLPASLERRLDLYWASGEPALMRLAAEAAPEATSEAAPDRAAFRELIAAGLDAGRAKERVREMAEAGAFGAAVGDDPEDDLSAAAAELADAG